MTMLSLDKLSPGMVLAAGVQDKCGRLLLGEGVELEAKHLFIFRTWGIVEADIAGVDDDTIVLPDDISLEELENAKTSLLPFYRHADIKHPAISELFHLAALRMVTHARR